MNFKTALKTAALATALAFSTAGQAADPVLDAYDHAYNGGGMANVRDGDQAFSGIGVQGVAAYDMTNLANASQSFLAFCIAPNIGLVDDAHYFANYNANLTSRYGLQTGNTIKALFETAYGSLSSDDSKVAFQLALWELVADEGHLDAGTQIFHLTDDADDSVKLAYGMLSNANTYLAEGGKLTTYSYTTFNVGNGAPASQELLGASIAAVPEADTWAMLTAGLGLIGFMGRRRSNKSEKFAA